MRTRPVLSLLLLLAAAPAAGQRTPSLALAADIGPAFPLGEFSDDGARRGWGFGASATLRVTRLLGAFIAAERTTFDVEESASPGDGTWTDDGLSVGVRAWLPVRDDARVHPWAQLGVGWHDVDPPIAGAEFAGLETDGIRTLESGAGVDVAILREKLFLRPAARYRKYDFELELGDDVRRTSVSSLTVAVGVGVAFSLRRETP